MIKFIENNFWVLMGIVWIFAYFFPWVFLSLDGFWDEILMIALFLWFIKIDFSEITHLKENKLKMTWLIILYMVIIPIIYFYLFSFFDNNIKLWLFLMACASSAMVSPLLTSIYKLRILWATVFVCITSFLLPFTIPILLKILFSLEINIPFISMSLFLWKIIFIPAIIAILFKKHLNKTTNSLIKTSWTIWALCMITFIWIVISTNQLIIQENIFSIFAIKTLFWHFVLFLSLFMIWYLIPGKDIKEKLTNSLIFWNMNNWIIILFTNQFFQWEIALVALFSEIIWIWAQPFFTWFVKKKTKQLT